MPDAARIAQATPLEIPVTIQGSRAVDGTDQRELFTETTKTILTFHSGAALHLRSKVEVGQSLFLRNEQSGKEILCRVLEAPGEGQGSFTDLEFTVEDPEFWNLPEESIAGVEESVPPEAIVPVSKSTVTSPRTEVRTAVKEELSCPSDPVPEPPPAEPPSPAPEATPVPAEPAAEEESRNAKDAEQLAAMMAADAKGSSRRASAPRESKQVKAAAAPQVEPKKDEAKRRVPDEPKAFSTLAFRMRGVFEFRRFAEPITLKIAAGVLIAIALGVAWRETRGLAIPVFRKSASVSPKLQPVPIQPPPPQAPVATAGAIAKMPDTPKADLAVPVKNEGVENSAAAAPPTPEVSESAPKPGPSSSADAKPQEPREPKIPEIIPPRIVSQPQPPLPPWATNLEIGAAVVKLDAVIDEKGNLVEATPLSGPRALQRAAQEAANLWQFQPALSDGKPTATHMVLTVEFQAPPQKNQ